MVAVQSRRMFDDKLREEKADPVFLVFRARYFIWKKNPKHGRVAVRKRSRCVSQMIDGGEECFVDFLLYCSFVRTLRLQS
jgi:hypothetical protein